MITIVEYKPEHQPVFERLNRAWIEKYFYMEEGDVHTLANPYETIIAQGGKILIALYDGVPAGTAALCRVDYATVKLAKMAVDENFHRKGIAEALGKACLEKAGHMGAERIILFSHSSLEAAISLYLKLGFKHLLLKGADYKRANVKMEKWLRPKKNATPDIKIIRATEEHAPAIAAVGKEAFNDTFGPLFVNKQELKEYLDHTYAISKIAHSITKESNVFYLAVAGEQPVGFVKLKVNSLHPQIQSLSQLELQKIYVLKEFHGSGAGAGLMKAALELTKLEQVEHLWLDTHVDNARGIRFYEKHGFKISGRHYFTIGTQMFEYHLMDLELMPGNWQPAEKKRPKPETSLSNQ